MSFRLRFVIKAPVGRKLRVLIYARYSTEDQHPSSIDDQIAYCKEFLKDNGVTDAEIVVHSDPEISGELVSRPGINEVRKLIESRWPDIVICEDTSRLFRHETACGELIETAVDLNIRVIAINDDVDTMEEDWDDRVHEAARHHARANKYTSRRIKRKLEGLWRTGAAIGLLSPGYKRKPTVPATEDEPAKGPFFDELDAVWTPIIYEAFERIASKESPWLVGRWLTEQKLPKCSNAKNVEWDDDNVVALIQRTIYRAWDTYRVTRSTRKKRSGEPRQIRNEPELVLTRTMEHLRIVPDWLWYAANEAIQERMLREPGPSGLDHPLTGIPRNSRGPLSGIFACGVCNGKMYKEGGEGADYRSCYRCSNASHGLCWNKATAQVSIVHEQLGKVVIEKLTSLDGVLDPFLVHVTELYQDDQPRKARQADLAAKVKEGQLACQRLLDAIEQGKDVPGLLLERLRQRQDEVAYQRAQLEALDAPAPPRSPPTKQQILDKIEAIAKKLLAGDREQRELLKGLVTPIRAVPHQQFGSNKVVLRARFELRLAGLISDQILLALRGSGDLPLTEGMHIIPVTVDLFKPSSGPKYFAEALQLSRAGLTLEQIGKRLGTAKRQAHIAVQYGRDLEAAGLTDPYLELTEAPTAASHWRTLRG